MGRNKKAATAVVAVLYLCGLALLVGLGSWQLLRGLEKRALRDHFDSQVDDMGQTVGIFSASDLAADADYRPAILTGEWLPGITFALDNRIHQGVAGYELLTPFRLSGGGAILVNRGWTSKADLDQVPQPPPGQPTGVLYTPGRGVTLGPAFTDADARPVVVQYIDLAAFSELIGQPLSERVLVLDPGDDSSTVRIWQPYVMSPERHYGYAAQWWGLAIVFLVFGVIWMRMARRVEPGAGTR